MAFWLRKRFLTFEKRAPGPLAMSNYNPENDAFLLHCMILIATDYVHDTLMLLSRLIITASSTIH